MRKSISRRVVTAVLVAAMMALAMASIGSAGAGARRMPPEACQTVSATGGNVSTGTVVISSHFCTYQGNLLQNSWSYQHNDGQSMTFEGYTVSGGQSQSNSVSFTMTGYFAACTGSSNGHVGDCAISPAQATLTVNGDGTYSAG